MQLHVDYALVGGGLQNGLLALALRAVRPRATIAVVERARALGGNHTWCFHAGDVPAEARAIVEPLVVQRWPGYQVAFPGLARELGSEYARISAPRLDAVVRTALAGRGHHVLTSCEATAVEPRRVLARRADGGAIELVARAVIEARGPDRGAFDDRAGYQKFVGLEVRCAAPHGLKLPRIMDARVAQLDGFRFLYALPLDERRLLLEDTYFSDSAYLDVAALRARIAEYAVDNGWLVAEIEREETGVLPMPWHAEPVPLSADGPLLAGYQGGWFHPATGYSLPVALRLALAVAATEPRDLPGAAVATAWRAHQRQLALGFRLNWMLFRWFGPSTRRHVLERFYRLPEPTIRRFYACALTRLDAARLFIGRPPRGMSWRAALCLPSPTPPLRLAKEPR